MLFNAPWKPSEHFFIKTRQKNVPLVNQAEWWEGNWRLILRALKIIQRGQTGWASTIAISPQISSRWPLRNIKSPSVKAKDHGNARISLKASGVQWLSLNQSKELFLSLKSALSLSSPSALTPFLLQWTAEESSPGSFQHSTSKFSIKNAAFVLNAALSDDTDTNR